MEAVRQIIRETIRELFEGSNMNDRFVSWFGSSKVKEGGKPMVLYHGSKSSFDSFDTKHIRYVGNNGDGFYFSPDAHESKMYGDNVREFYLKIENPLSPNDKNLSTDSFKSILQYIWDNTDHREDLKNYGYFDDEQFESFRDALAEDLSKKDDYSALFDLTLTAVGSIRELAKITEASTGIKYDGVISPVFREYVAFFPNQIKSIDNDGTWDSGDSNIYS
jgi:ADP-Ribosyltransferase in polyvalent proteins